MGRSLTPASRNCGTNQYNEDVPGGESIFGHSLNKSSASRIQRSNGGSQISVSGSGGGTDEFFANEIGGVMLISFIFCFPG